MLNNKKIFTSGWDFKKSEQNLKNRFQMINVALLLSSLSLVFGIFSNMYKETYEIIPLEGSIIVINTVLFFILRRCRKGFKIVSPIVSIQYALFFLFLYYSYPPEALKFIWLFTYPIVLLYFQEKKYARYFMIFVISMILVSPFQPLVAVQFSAFQAIYLAVVLAVVSVIITFYQSKMDEAKSLIIDQQVQLQGQIDELVSKDKLLSVQSKQAVMGEMISMIAHQWRQPLSTVTLTISDIQLKKLLGTKVEEETLDKTLQEISDTVVYLSDTIDDFQTYFAPNKEINEVTIDEIIEKVINFTKARLKGTEIVIDYKAVNDKVIETYSNELIQVILNIINNAIDELVEMKKSNPLITIYIRDQDEDFELIIKDNAGGIKAEKIEEIFEPYYSTKGKNGTGLGLYMSQMIVQKQFNSKIEVISSPKGSIFSMVIPKKLS